MIPLRIERCRGKTLVFLFFTLFFIVTSASLSADEGLIATIRDKSVEIFSHFIRT